MKNKFLLGSAALFLAPLWAQAHVLPGDVTGFHHGLTHPLAGWDHLLAMLAVGLWAVQQKGRAKWVAPLAFVASMTIGATLGMTSAAWPGVEIILALSVFVLGGLLAGAVPLAGRWSGLLVGFFALFHGYAHGREMPTATSSAGYALGFVIATILLHLLGMGLGWTCRKTSRQPWLRFAGAAMMVVAMPVVLARLWA